MTRPDHPIDSSPADLIKRIREIIFSARSLAARSIDTAQVAMNFAIGQRIVEHEQAGVKRAAYGRKVLESLAEDLTAEFGRGFSRRNLNLTRQFYLVYKLRGEQTLLPAPTNLADSVRQIEPSVLAPQIRQTLPAELRPFS